MRNKGFTLVELIISLSLILIILGVAVPGVISYQELQTEEQFLNQVVNQLRLYQATALTKDTTTNFKNTPNSFTFCDISCTNLTYSRDIFDASNFYMFNSLGELVDSNGNLSNGVVIKTTKFQIIIGKYGRISKEKL